MTVGDDYLGRFVVIEFRGRHKWQYVSFEVDPVDATISSRIIGYRGMSNVCEKIKKFTEKVINTPAREALGTK